ncbi:p-hydroxybenzoate 3-monooxygenase [Streptomyces sp. V3I8]|uniref:4-hydroxybenzoate 3-monooxygenase n=1 Tax=Streptomyces sp. V3I8 TaxID=3042279 RepID=UPI0027810BDA|nr:4-hydroxybenzoate 3-monooxygenase [Streptomyces sp. V3I8]MDQ1034266.1 p-hydroxybenzoate 3-monooxygenase [Streptomyces sp. V3I8]
MTETSETTTVVIVGAGVAGLTLGTLLLRNGIDCIVLEKRSRAYVEQRQRAGTIDTRGVRLFRAWGLEEVLAGNPVTESQGGFFIDGEEMPIDTGDDNESLYCPQQVLVRNLTDVFLRDGGDLRFEAADVALEGIQGPRPLVRHRDATGSAVTIGCDVVAGCDGYHGVSRASIPEGVLTRFSHAYGYSWLSVLAGIPASHPSGMAIHSRGLAGLIPRGANASRIYLQCPLDDTVEQWPDERIWSELGARFGTSVTTGPIAEKRILPLRSVVHSPMSHGRLYLLGDAAHIVPPMSAKGINLALNDAEVLARALVRYSGQGDTSLLDSYSDACLSHIWNYQAFAAWITELMHNAGDASHAGEFRKQIARAELQRQFTSPAANQLFSELTSGVN